MFLVIDFRLRVWNERAALSRRVGDDVACGRLLFFSCFLLALVKRGGNELGAGCESMRSVYVCVC